MSDDAPPVCSFDAGVSARSNPNLIAQTGQSWKLWLKRTNAGDYGLLVDVQPGSYVYNLTARWLSEKNLSHLDPACTSLYLVRHKGKEPDPEGEKAAKLLNPRQTLLEAGITDGSALLVDYASALKVLREDKDVTQPLLNLVLAIGQLGIFSARAPPCSSSSASSKSEQKNEQKRAQSTLRTKALQAYGYVVADGTLPCSVLCTALPAAAVTCAHLVPRMLHAHWANLGISDDDPRNVMFMFKCIEEAFDDHLLSFFCTGSFDSDGRDLFRVYVWDPSLLDLPVTMNVRNRDERRELRGVQLPETVERITFRSLHERAPVALAGPSGLSPYRRALALQSILARAKARHNGWPDAPPALVELKDSVSPEMSPSKEEQVRAWRAATSAAAEDVQGSAQGAVQDEAGPSGAP